MADIEDRSEDLDLALEIAAEWSETKELIALDYLEHRISFSGMIERFESINNRDADMMDQFHEHYPGCDAREIAARNAAVVVDNMLVMTSEKRKIARQRLIADFLAIFPNSPPPTFID